MNASHLTRQAAFQEYRAAVAAGLATPLVPRAQLGDESSIHCYAEEASTLGFPVGGWPAMFQVHPPMGNRMPFSLSISGPDRAVYHQIGGCVSVAVFND